MTELNQVFERLGELTANIDAMSETTQKNYKRTGDLFDRTDELKDAIEQIQREDATIPEHHEHHEFIVSLKAKMEARAAFYESLRNKLIQKGVIGLVTALLLIAGVGFWQYLSTKFNIG